MDPDEVAKLRAMFGGGAPAVPQGMAQHLQPPTPPPSPPGGLISSALGNGMNPPGPPPPTGVPYTAPSPASAPAMPPPGQGFGGGAPMQQQATPPLSPPLINPQTPPPSSGLKGALREGAGALAELGNMKPIPQFHDAQFAGYVHPQHPFAPNVGPLKMPKNW